MFEDAFVKIQEKNPEIRMLGVWGKDGLELDKKFFADAGGLDMELAGAELADVIAKLESIRLSPEQYFIKLDFHGLLLLVYSLTPEYFLMILSTADIISGKLKFSLRSCPILFSKSASLVL